MPERVTNSSPLISPPEIPEHHHADSDIGRALSSLRTRVLLRVSLRWFWISSLCFDLALLAVAVYNPVWYENYSRTGMTAFMILYPVLVGVVRALSMRLSVDDVAKLADYRAGLSEQVSSAYEINDRSAQSAESMAFSNLLSDRALEMLRRAEAKIIVPLQRETICAGLATILAITLCLWRTPELVSWAIAGKQAAGSISPSSSSLPTEEQPVHVVGPQSPSANSPQQAPTPIAQQQHHYQQGESPTTTVSHGNQQNGDTNRSASGGPKPVTKNGQSGQKSGTGSSTGQHSQASGNQPNGKGGPNAASNNSGSSSQGSGSTPGSQSGNSGQPSKPSNGNKPGSGNAANGNSGKQAQSGHSGTGSNADGKHGSGQGSQSASGDKSGSGSGQGKSPGQGSGTGKSSSGQQGSGQGQSAQGTPSNGGQGQQKSGTSAGQGPGSSNNSNSGPGQSGMQHAESHDSKPNSVGSRVLPDMAHKTTQAFKIPNPKKPNQSASLQYGRSTSKNVPVAENQDESGYASPVNAGSSEPVQAVEHDPTIPAGYRDLVKRYFSAASKAAHP